MPLSSVPPHHLLSFLNQTAVVTWAVGPDGHVMDVPHWCELTGQTPEEAEGDGWLLAIHPEDRTRVAAAWSTAIDHAQHFNTDYRVRCADGVFRWFNARGSPVRSPGGEIEGWVGVCLEIPGLARFGGASVRSTEIKQDIEIDTLDASIIRAARAMLSWNASDLAERSRVSLSTIRRMESEENAAQPRRAIIDRLVAALEHEGLVLVGVDGKVVGVRWK